MPLTSSLCGLVASLAFCSFPACLFAQTPVPRLISENGHHALLVDGAPYLVLGAQIGNSSAWPALLPSVWPALEAMHVNTVEAPVYWEQMEPKPGQFDWTNVDALIDGARVHHLHLVLLWFGTWKNGNDHYVPQWVKHDPLHFPRMINSAGAPLDDLSANATANMEADRRAFSALMHHLAERDSTEHTILMIQVENESGGIGSVRDFSPASNREFAEPVPAALVKALNRNPGTWVNVFPGHGDEAFQAWHQARYVNAVAEAGKREFNIPFYCNVWLAYPPAELPERHISVPGLGYPSGGPNQYMLPIWKAAAPSIDAIGPDLYSSNPEFVMNVMDLYSRPDNPLWIPESGSGDEYAPFLFAALGKGGIGFSPFGIDWTGSMPVGSVPRAHAANYALLGPMDRTVAQLSFSGKVQTLIEVSGGAEQEKLLPAHPEESISRLLMEAGPVLLNSAKLANAMVRLDEAGTPATRAADAAGDWVVEARFGFPQRDGQPAPGSAGRSGRLLVAQLGPNEFLLTGIGGALFFHRPGLLPGIRMQIMTAEEGFYTSSEKPGGADVWHVLRVLNGDETDRGIMFPDISAQITSRRVEQTASGDPSPTGFSTHQRMAVRIVLERF